MFGFSNLSDVANRNLTALRRAFFRLQRAESLIPTKEKLMAKKCNDKMQKILIGAAEGAVTEAENTNMIKAVTGTANAYSRIGELSIKEDVHEAEMNVRKASKKRIAACEKCG